MRFSSFFIPTIKEVPSDAKIRSHALMIKSGMIRQETSGIYTWLPMGFKVLKNIISQIEKMHDEFGVNQILMPTIQSAEIWKRSNRYDTYGKEMLRISDRHQKELLYGPTNEEMITAIGKQYIRSYKSFPLSFYHIQSKFRDEIRPRFGVMRAREFLMKDAYSFDINEENGEKTYHDFFKLYLKIFKKLEIPIIPVRAPSGEIGGNLSHEFHLIVKSGESEIFLEEDLLENKPDELSLKEILELQSFTDDYYKQLSSPNGLKKFRSIELGHIFLFGTKYSDSFDFNVDSDKGQFKPFMGSYGIGISRIPAAVIEHSNDENGIIWPKAISPFKIEIINLLINDAKCRRFSENLYMELLKRDIEVIIDDRDERPGKKFSDADLIGIPVQVICGNSFKNNDELSVITRKGKTEKKINSDQILTFLIDMIR
ncbi:MAG: proline--tRNA ligase [Pseudomonadota bacterium]|nr:proline--tRNA ligase [Pseudomonadota bacterium]